MIRDQYHINTLLSNLSPGYEDREVIKQSKHKSYGHPVEEVPFSAKTKRRPEVIYDPYRSRVEHKISHENYYNPNDYIQITPKEIEEQAKANLEQMKENDKWRAENQKTKVETDSLT